MGFLTGGTPDSFPWGRRANEAVVSGHRVGGGDVALRDVAVVELTVGGDAPVAE